MSTRSTLPLRWTLSFGVSYAAFAVLARLTVVDGQSVGLVWPGAGVAMLWLLAESPRRQLWVLAPLMAIHAGVNWLTGAPLLVVFFGSLSVTVQTWLLVALLRRWCPTLLGAGGTESFRSPRTLGCACAAAAVGSLVGASIGAYGVWLAGSGWDAWVPQAWFGRHFSGILVFGCIGHLAWERRIRRVAPRTRGGTPRELVVVWAVSALVVALVFLQPLPIVFLVIPLSVWSAVRFSTFSAALHALALAVGGFILTLVGQGPAAGMRGEPVEAALVGQIFLVAIVLTTLVVGTLSDRIDELVGRMGQAHELAAEQAELLAEMTESMAEGLIVLDAEGRIEQSNGASRRLARRVRPGAPEPLALAELVRLVLHPAADHTGAQRAELGVGDVQVPLDSGEDLVIAVSRALLPTQRGEGGGSGELLVLREVTEHRQGMRPLVSFASTAAHDLRGPLTAIRSWLDLAALDLEPDSESLSSIKRAERATVQMAGLIDDLLAHAVAEAGDLDARDVALSGADGVLSPVAALLGPEDALEVPDGLPRVRADEIAMRQLFGNLVGNAVKYARPGVPARVRVSARRQGSRVVVDVEDNGVGVDDHERALIFQRFHRSDAVPGSGGTGMGLSICQAIVHRHGGSIECLAAESGPGSVFQFDLPAAAPDARPPTASPAPSGDALATT